MKYMDVTVHIISYRLWSRHSRLLDYWPGVSCGFLRKGLFDPSLVSRLDMYRMAKRRKEKTSDKERGRREKGEGSQGGIAREKERERETET
jgi:hypothetical protein